MTLQNINQTEYIAKTRLSEKAFTLVHNELSQQVRSRTLALSEANAALQEQVVLRTQAEQLATKYKNQLEKMYQIIMALSTAPNYQQALQIVCEALGKIFSGGQVMAAVGRYNNPGCTIIAESCPADNNSMLGMSLNFENDAIFQQLISSKRPLLIDNAQNKARLSQLCQQFSQHNIETLLVTPILIDDQVVGGLVVGAQTGYQFSAQETGYVWAMTKLIGGYITHTNLLQRSNPESLLSP